MAQMRHDNQANAIHQVVSAYSYKSAAWPCYLALAGSKADFEWKCQGYILAVLPQLVLAAVDVVVAYAFARSYAPWGSKKVGQRRGLNTQCGHPSAVQDVLDHAAFRFVPFQVDTCGYIGKDAVRFMNSLGDITAENGRIPKGEFVRWAMQLLSLVVQRGNPGSFGRDASAT